MWGPPQKQWRLPPWLVGSLPHGFAQQGPPPCHGESVEESSARHKERLATLDFSFEVGDEGKDLQDEEGKIGIEIDVEHGDDATSTKAKLQVPSQCAASVSGDLPAREDADPDEVRRLRKDLKLFLDKYVVPHVQELTPGFQQVRVVKVLPYVPPEDDAAAAKKKFNKPEPVDEDEEDEPEPIRVQFLWKSEANVDYFLRRRVGLGLGLATGGGLGTAEAILSILVRFVHLGDFGLRPVIWEC